ncbi:MAG: pseudaminic acid biosynthesis-associated protein [Desulfovibrionaceae bacterium]|nr:MAG: pseudaminic acid biosynthesis-associated protein [Desulfovibrionaceae bacterium]
MNGPRLILRADAGPDMGVGHAMRLLALGVAWKARGLAAAWAAHDPMPALARRFQALGIDVLPLSARHPDPVDMRALETLARESGPGCWVALDGYHFDESCQTTLKKAGARVLWLDDFGACPRYYADLVLNQNAWHDPDWYGNLAPGSMLLTGPSHALLRPEFSAPPPVARSFPAQARRVLVSLGGADPLALAPRVVDGLARCVAAGLEAVVVSGPANPTRSQLRAACQRAGAGFTLAEYVTDMPGLMAWADVAILAGGVSCLEAAAMGLPMLLTGFADNQRGNVRGLCSAGAAVNLDWGDALTADGVAGQAAALLADPEARKAMSQAGRAFVDAKGARRVLAAMLAGPLRLRPVESADCELLFRWANDSATRANAFCSDPIPWENHVAWFSRKLAAPGSLLFLAHGRGGVPVGQIRFDRDGDAALIDFSVAPGLRGLGLGSNLLSMGIEVMRHAWGPDVTALGQVKRGNKASAASFVRAGFRLAEPGKDNAAPEGADTYRVGPQAIGDTP